MPEYLIWLWVGGGIGFLLGWLLLYQAKKADAENYIIQRATPMPLSLVNVRDDVWLRGKTECETPVDPPHFSMACLHYDYKLEEQVEETYTDSEGKRRTRKVWKTRETKSESAQFELHQDDLSIKVDGNKADWRDLSSTSDRIGRWRHNLSYIRHPNTVSAVGTISEKREWLEPYANIPLMVTPQERDAFIEDAESGERWLRRFGFFFILVGSSTLFYGLFDHLAWPVQTHQKFQWTTFGAGVFAGLVVLFPIWFIHAYNTFINYRNRTENAWRQIDVDLKMRYELIPRLVSTVSGYMKHESGLLESLTKLRQKSLVASSDEKIELERDTLAGLHQFYAVKEKYPDLKGEPVMAKLTRELKAIEEKISHGRTIFNEAVKEYNDNVMSLPQGLLARMFGFKTKTYFRVLEQERKALQIKLDEEVDDEEDGGQDDDNKGDDKS